MLEPRRFEIPQHFAYARAREIAQTARRMRPKQIAISPSKRMQCHYLSHPTRTAPRLYRLMIPRHTGRSVQQAFITHRLRVGSRRCLSSRRTSEFQEFLKTPQAKQVHSHFVSPNARFQRSGTASQRSLKSGAQPSVAGTPAAGAGLKATDPPSILRCPSHNGAAHRKKIDTHP